MADSPFSIGERLVRAFHHRYPGASSAAMMHADGGASYELLAELADAGYRTASTPRPMICDLGCGDGVLLAMLRDKGVPATSLMGVDISLSELALARTRPQLAHVGLLGARAQALPLPPAQLDVVLSHLAFTMMDHPEAVVAELARVLRPGAIFATIVGGGPRIGDSFAYFADVLAAVCRRDGVRPPRLGDIRARSDRGLHQLFRPESGFCTDIDIDDIYVSLDGTPEQVWHRLSSLTYEMLCLDDRTIADMRTRFVGDCHHSDHGHHWRRADGTIACTMALRLVRCRRSTAPWPLQ